MGIPLHHLITLITARALLRLSSRAAFVKWLCEKWAFSWLPGKVSHIGLLWLCHLCHLLKNEPGSILGTLNYLSRVYRAKHFNPVKNFIEVNGMNSQDNKDGSRPSQGFFLIFWYTQKHSPVLWPAETLDCWDKTNRLNSEEPCKHDFESRSRVMAPSHRH